MKLRDKKILVTGGSSGIGKATAIMLKEAGARVMITGRDLNKLESVAGDFGFLPLHLDMTDYDKYSSAVNEIQSKLDGLDVLINNAGVGEFALLEDLDIGQFERVFSTNVFGLSLLTKELLPLLKKSGNGNIINIASTAALKGFEWGSVYSASKFALRGLTQCWQAELRKHNIRVFLINPSEVTTAFNNSERTERDEVDNKLRSEEIAHSIKSALEMDDRGFIPELTVWATNPFS